MNIVDLFCGLGGFTIGAIQAANELGQRVCVSLACDIDPDCQKVYKANFSDVIKKYHDGDVLGLDLGASLGKIDYLFAGPPCQGHSNLNNSSRRSDPRNLLYLETINVITSLQPSIFVIENVPSVVHSREQVVQELKCALGSNYQIRDYIVDFERLGVAQARKRHVLIGRDGFLPLGLMDLIYSKHKKKILKDVIGDLADYSDTSIFNTPSKMSMVNLSRAKYLFDNGLYDLPNECRPSCHQSRHSYKSMYGRLDWHKPAQTITGGFGSMGQGRYLHPSALRVITPHEAARIQGIPDDYDFSAITKRTSLQTMIGNAVPPVLAKELILAFEGGKSYETEN